MSKSSQPLAVKLTEGLGPDARTLAGRLQNAAYNCGYEDAHPSNATTRQAKADAKCREALIALHGEIDRLKADAARQVAAERERCAKLCDGGAEQFMHAYKREAAARLAVMIRGA